MSELTSAAAEQLRAIETGASAGDAIGRAGRTHDAAYAMAVGVLIAAMLAVVVYIYPGGVSWLIATSTLVYGVGIALVGAIYRHHHNGTSRVSARRYRVGFFITMSLYVIGVVFAVLRFPAPEWFWPTYIVATALPLLIASALRVRHGR